VTRSDGPGKAWSVGVGVTGVAVAVGVAAMSVKVGGGVCVAGGAAQAAHTPTNSHTHLLAGFVHQTLCRVQK